MSILLFNCSGGGGSSPGPANSADQTNDNLSSGSATGGERNPVCTAGDTSGEVGKPQVVMNLPGQTSWYASPLIADLDDDGRNELIAAYYSVFVYDSEGSLLDRIDGGSGRIYAPHLVVDLEGDGVAELVYGNSHEVYAYEWKNLQFNLKSGWPVDTTTAGESPEVRGLAAADLNGNGNGAPAAPTVGDLDGDGQLEIIVQTFDHGIDIFTVPGSGIKCILWETSRGGPLRMGQPNSNGL